MNTNFRVDPVENFREQWNIRKGSPVFSGRTVPNRKSSSISSKPFLIPVSGLYRRFSVKGTDL